MGVPIKSNNTQQGCNPISSNCVIWQGPDIPCIKMCTGDSVSDTIAKLATELCEITSELDISLLDLSCFNPLYPTPQSFRDVMQIILDKICALENGTVNNDKSNTSGCPQDCEVQIATCLQYQDYLGNNVTTLPLKDYVILIGNKICTILSDITNLQNQIDNLDVRVEALENAPSGSGSLFDVTSECVTQGSVTLQEYITALDTAFCELLGSTGTEQDYTNAALAASSCITGNSVQMANPPSFMGNYQNPPWLASPQNAMQQIQNLWVAVCDLRGGLTNLQAQLEECCAEPPACPTNLPIPEIYIKKTPSDSGIATNVYFKVTTPPAGWVLTGFSGTLQPSASTSGSLITVTFPTNAAIEYIGSESYAQSNILTQFPELPNSILLDVSSPPTWTWTNTDTGQTCTVTGPIRQITNNSVQRCPILPGSSGSPSFNYSWVPCSGNTTALAMGLSNFPIINNVSNSSLQVNVSDGTNTYSMTFACTTATCGNIGQVLTNLACSTTYTLSVASVTQNGYSVACSNTQGVLTSPGPAPQA